MPQSLYPPGAPGAPSGGCDRRLSTLQRWPGQCRPHGTGAYYAVPRAVLPESIGRLPQEKFRVCLSNAARLLIISRIISDYMLEGQRTVPSHQTDRALPELRRVLLRRGGSSFPGKEVSTEPGAIQAARIAWWRGMPGRDCRARPPVPARRAGSPARAPAQRGVADAWVSRVRPRGRVEREDNRGARRRRPCCRPSRGARPHLGLLQTAAVVVPQTWRVAGRPSISDENHHAATAVTAPEMEISLAQEQTTTCRTGSE